MCLISQSLFIKLKENPLCPLVVVFVTGADLSIPVIGEAKALYLTTEVVDVLVCGDIGVCPCLDCIILCRKAKRIESHWMKDVISIHSKESGIYISGCISLRVSYMETCS